MPTLPDNVWMMESTDSLEPWQQSQWTHLVERARQGQLPHALLLTGANGLGKEAFARRLAQGLLCEAPAVDGSACGQCRSCTLFAAGSHPDYRELAPAEAGKAIAVDQVRDSIAYLGLKSQYGGMRVVLITPAERMNVNAANSLLKTLEEPVAHTLLMLETSQPALLFPTIRSRCQGVQFPVPEPELARRWLEQRLAPGSDAAKLLGMASGAPLAALRMSEGDQLTRRDALFATLEALRAGQSDPIGVAEEWSQGDVGESLRWLYGWLADMVRLRSAPEARVASPDLGQRLQQLADGVDLQQLFAFLDRLQEALRLLRGQANQQMLLEDLLIGWGRLHKAH